MRPLPEHAVAIVGLAGRWPDAVDNAALWANLIGGHEAVRTFTPAELRAAGVPEALIAHPDYVPRGTTLPAHDRFDPGYFGLSPRDAERLDPQQRVLLELAVAALEDAGHGAGLDGAVGVFVGAGPDRYRRRNLDPWASAADEGDAYQREVDSDPGFAATRIAWHLGLTGPAVTVLTACSTGLVAVHMACQSLLAGECDLALAGAASMTVPQTAGYLFLEGLIAAPDGHCRAFDASARGTLGGNGAGLVALRRLEDALADGDAIRAIIRGTAVNNDGAGKISYTAPGVDGQAAVIREALAVAEVAPGSVDYVEAHGTGTPLGDPIEVAALNQAFAGVDGPVTLGAIKTHIGHADTAAGLAGLTKVVLALEHGLIPPTLHFERPNPAIDFAGGPFRVRAEATRWPRTDRPRRAGVSAFGVGGTNAHAVLEEAPAREPTAPGRRWQLLPISAKTPAALDRMTARLTAHLGDGDTALPDAAWTLAVGRRHHGHRRWARTDGAGRLDWSAPSEAKRRRVVFLLPGQGAQYGGMGRALYAEEPVFRAAFDRCADRLLTDGGPDLRALVYADPADPERLRATAVTQPAIFAVSYATAALWMSWGVTPDAVAGHSVGELVAAALAGVFTPEDALALVAERGRLMAACPPGAMLAVELSADALARRLEPDVALAAENGPTHGVIAGPRDAIDAMQASLEADGIECRRLHTSHAFHSPLMASAVEPFAARIARVGPQPPRLPLFSGLTGARVTDAEATDPHFWARQLVEPVRFGRALAALAADDAVFVEVGPGRTLSDLARRAGVEGPVTHSLPHPRDARDARACALDALGALWAAGVDVDWRGVYRGQRRRRVPLPTYAFERRRCWIDPPAAGAAPPPGAAEPRLYAPSWRRLPRAPASTVGEGTCLIFADAGGVGAALAGRLRAAGRPTAVVEPGAAFADRGDGRFTVRPEAFDDHRDLLARRPVDEVVHLWALDDGDARFERGPLAALALARALGGRAAPARVLLVGRRIASVNGEPADPERAALIGLARVAAQEHPHLRWRVLDADPAADPPAVAEAVLGESSHTEPLVAHRGPHRWLHGVEPLALADRPAPANEDGTWLITGGGGRIGRALVAHLGGRGARVAVLGRTAYPEMASATVLPLAVDVTDRAAVADAIARVEARFGPLRGVIHAAADTRDAFRLIGETDADDMRRHFAVKVDGLRALDAALGARPGLVRVAFSSLASTLGGLGFAAYAAGNAALDAAAAGWRCIGWDGWRFEGEAAPTGATTPGIARSAEPPALTPAQGLAAFERALAAPPGDPVLVAVGDLPARLRRWVTHVEPEPRTPDEPVGDAIADPTGNPIVDPPEGPIESTLAGLWRDLLGVDSPGRHVAFWDLGGHSLLGTRLMARIRETFAVAPTLRDLFDAPTIAGLAARIEALIAPAREADADDDIEEGFL